MEPKEPGFGESIPEGEQMKIGRLNPLQENPIIIEALKRHRGDAELAFLELAKGDLNDPEVRACLARLLHEWDKFSKNERGTETVH